MRRGKTRTLGDSLSARRRYRVLSGVLVCGWAGLTVVVTLRFAEAPQLGVWRIIFPIALWVFLAWVVWTLRKAYVRMPREFSEKHE